MAQVDSQTLETALDHLSDVDTVTESNEEAQPEDNTAADTGDSAVNGAASIDHQDDLAAVPEQVEPAPAEEEKETEKPQPANTGTKAPMATKPGAGKANGGPMSPIVKKVLNSGTFGHGSVKTAVSKPTTTSTTASGRPSAAPAALKKSTSASAAPTKPTMASSRSAATTGTTSAPARRASMAPSKTSSTPPPTRGLSSSTTSRPTAGTTASSRASAAPPTDSAAKATASSRPRASVSDGVKRAPLSSRQSLAPASKAPTTTTAKSAAKPAAPTISRPPRAGASISSIREVREDGKALEDLQGKLTEANEALTSKTAAATELEARLEELKSSLEAALADAEAKSSLVGQLEEEKAASEQQLKEAQAALVEFKSAHEEGDSILEQVRQELAGAKAAALTQQELVQTLQAQIEGLETQLVGVNENFEAVKASHTSASSEAAAAASIEHEALLKAQADFVAIKEETEKLEAVHAKEMEELSTKIKDLESISSGAETLQAQLKELRSAKEESANKVSELEIEILELKESQETIEDERTGLLEQIEALRVELSTATAATQKALDDAQSKELEYQSQADGTTLLHQEALKAASEEQAKVASRLEALQTELAGAVAAHEQSKADAQTAVEEHIRKLEETEQGHLAKQGELSDDIKRITAELEGQEAQYNAKVDVVKADHEKALQEAFARAKDEAAEQHRQHLQEARENFDATASQIATQKATAIDELKAEHDLALETQVKALEKQISTLSVDLKATQEDLAKAKAAAEASRAEIERLTAQNEEARAAAAAPAEPSPELTAEIERLKKELSIAKDDQAANTDMLNLTKASLDEMSQNHVKELEEAAKARADEVTKLRKGHDEEISSLATQKSEILVRLSDLEGELSTVKAAAAAEPVAPKSNGAAAPQSPGVTKEELQRLHEAHNLKVHDLQADHDKALKALKEELENSLEAAAKLREEVARKAMEIQYNEQEQDESAEQITRLKADIDTLTEQLKAKE